MIQRLFIAEKPSLGKAIAAELGVTQTRQGYMVCGNDTVEAVAQKLPAHDSP